MSYGAGCSEMTVRKPRSTYGRSRSAISSGEPSQNVSSSSTSVRGVRLWASAALRTCSASAFEARMVSFTPSVNSMSVMSRPTASQWPRRMSTLRARNSGVPIAFHRSA